MNDASRRAVLRALALPWRDKAAHRRRLRDHRWQADLACEPRRVRPARKRAKPRQSCHWVPMAGGRVRGGCQVSVAVIAGSAFVTAA